MFYNYFTKPFKAVFIRLGVSRADIVLTAFHLGATTESRHQIKQGIISFDCTFLYSIFST